jgi:hypothetical protein
MIDSIRRWVDAQRTGIEGQRAPRQIPGPVVLLTLFWLLGSLAVPIIGWGVAVILIWRSAWWSRRAKWIVTLMPPFGLLPFAIALASPLLVSNCVNSPSLRTTASVRACAASVARPSILELIASVIFLVMALVTTFYLIRSYRSERIDPSR